MKRNLNWMMALFLMVGVSLLCSGWVQQESAKELFEKALYLEETKGELEEAVDIYKRVVNKFPDERVTAAKAQFRIGICYEKLGFKEAEKMWGGQLPDISYETLNRALEAIDQQLRQAGAPVVDIAA